MNPQTKIENPSKIKISLGINYLVGCNSPKLGKSMTAQNVMTYLASNDISGHNVCPNSGNCSKHCLYDSRRNKIEQLTYKNSGVIHSSKIRAQALINIEEFTLDEKSILQIFPNLQFYDLY